MRNAVNITMKRLPGEKVPLTIQSGWTIAQAAAHGNFTLQPSDEFRVNEKVVTSNFQLIDGDEVTIIHDDKGS